MHYKPARFICPWDFPCKTTGVHCHFLFQGIFLTQGANPHLLNLLYWQADSLTLSHLGGPQTLQNDSVQFSSVTQLCPTLCDAMGCSTPGLPLHHQLPEFTQTHVHWVGDAIQPSHPLLYPSPPAFNLSQHQEISQHQELFKWVSSSQQVARVLEFHLQHQSFQWTPRTDLL